MKRRNSAGQRVAIPEAIHQSDGEEAWIEVNASGLKLVDGFSIETHSLRMKGEFTAVIEAMPEGGYWAICPEVPGANGQGESVEEAKSSLRGAIRLLFEDRLEDIRRGLPGDAIESVVVV